MNLMSTAPIIRTKAWCKRNNGHLEKFNQTFAMVFT